MRTVSSTIVEGYAKKIKIEWTYHSAIFFTKTNSFPGGFCVQPSTAKNSWERICFGEKQHAVYLETSVVMGIVIFVKRQTKVSTMVMSISITSEYFQLGMYLLPTKRL